MILCFFIRKNSVYLQSRPPSSRDVFYRRRLWRIQAMKTPKVGTPKAWRKESSRFARGTPSVSLRSTDLRRSACLLPAQRAASSTPSKKEPFGAFYDFLQNSPILFHISFISARTVLSITSHTDSKCLSTSALEKRMTVIPYSSRPAVRLSSYAFPSFEKCWLPSNSIANLAFAQ